ncbi:MAG: type II secretion system F family protein [Acidimicrobiales bacterium]
MNRNRTFAVTLGTVFTAAALVLAPAAPVAAQTGGELVVEGIDASGFPLVRAVVEGPPVAGELDDAFVLTENGEPISVDVVRLRSDEMNVVVALDISGSMGGEPLERAKAALGDLLDTLPESVPVSVVTFGDGADVLTPFSVNRAITREAVGGLVAAGQTALYDAIQLSLNQLTFQGGSSALVVLADGADTFSTASIDDTVANLEATEVEVSFVALQTPDYNPAGFEQMATAAGGDVLTVDQAAQFSDAMTSVAAGLGTSYELRWRSASTGDAAEIAVALASDPAVSVTSDYAHEAVTGYVADVATATRTEDGAGIFSSSLIPIVAALLVSAGTAVILWMMRNSATAVERREERSSSKESRKLVRKKRLDDVQGRLNDISAQVLETNDRGRSLDDTLDRAGLAIRSNEFVVACAAILLASLLVGVLLFGIPFFLLGALFPAAGIPLTLKVLTARRRKAFINQLGDTLQLITGSLTAGYGLGQTLDAVSREAESPTKEEFARVVMETRLGRSLEDALDAMSRRINAPDFDWVVDAIKIQSSVGGNLSEIIEQVGETIRARVRIKRQVDALTAEGKISALVLFFLPFGLCGFIFISNPTYIEPLYTSGIGFVLLGVAGLMLSVGGLWLKKLVNPEF